MFNYMGDNSPTDIYNPNDPSSQFYCDSIGVDDPACYAPGGYYGPGGAGYQAPQQSGGTDPAGGTYTLPVQVFNTTTPIPVGRPEPTPMPISQTLDFQMKPPTPEIVSYGPLLLIGVLVALAVFSGKGKGN